MEKSKKDDTGNHASFDLQGLPLTILGSTNATKIVPRRGIDELPWGDTPKNFGLLRNGHRHFQMLWTCLLAKLWMPLSDLSLKNKPKLNQHLCDPEPETLIQTHISEVMWKADPRHGVRDAFAFATLGAEPFKLQQRWLRYHGQWYHQKEDPMVQEHFIEKIVDKISPSYP